MNARLDALPGRDLPGGLRIVEARTRRSRGKGLARMDTMPSHLGLELAPCRSVHTFGMRFALDLIWLDAEGAVVRVDERVPPRRFRTCWRARSVIETLGGASGPFLAEDDRGDPERDER
ncbi:DUF192 domain-containing protein [Solirubrobacter phytolaccae]|uniref:DUF192 domain-containing protein n=1 Tax=Solirubrobacter phytolaccae TaxID=1404360 RepID=A0A9X3NAY6_9ACTN|nr:DUF192 domain-containing protein [Solirubrobacter phytolaccae]MDA0181764.1 DUF192 domain-containing protein [Solirubrobacter phytolaccae]